MPLTYGGGIRTVEQARKLFALGIEKICLQSSIGPIQTVFELVKRFGTSSIVASIDIKRNWYNAPTLFDYKSVKLSL